MKHWHLCTGPPPEPPISLAALPFQVAPALRIPLISRPFSAGTELFSSSLDTAFFTSSVGTAEGGGFLEAFSDDCIAGGVAAGFGGPELSGVLNMTVASAGVEPVVCPFSPLGVSP